MNELAPYATSPTDSKGRRYSEPSPNNRSEFQRDRDRIVHSAAFRRLEYKTQVFVNHEGDMFRTRMTHTIEVAQISRSIARALNTNEDLTETIALAHDLGHTPFGHAGQDILNECMSPFGGFEHNMQALRIVDELEEKYAEFNGLNLTFETREGMLKHCSRKKAAALGELGSRFINNQQAGIEAQITNLADEIAYVNHDVDDGLRSGLLTIPQMLEVDLFKRQYDIVTKHYPKISERRIIHEVIRRMVNIQVTDLIDTTQAAINKIRPNNREAVVNLGSPIVSYSTDMESQKRALKTFLRHGLYQHYRVRRMSLKGQNVIKNMFSTFMNDPNLLPPEAQQKIAVNQELNGEFGKAQSVADYIAGMTDRYAIQEYEKIFSSSALT